MNLIQYRGLLPPCQYAAAVFVLHSAGTFLTRSFLLVRVPAGDHGVRSGVVKRTMASM